MGKIDLREILRDSYGANRGVAGFLKRVHLKIYRFFHFHLFWLFQILTDRMDDRLDQLETRITARFEHLDNRLEALSIRDDETLDSGVKTKRLNLLSALEHRRYRDLVLTSMPPILNLAGSSRCNLRCIMCERSIHNYDNVRRIKPLPPDLFRDFAEEAFPAASYLRLNTSGEPLLSENIDLELEYAEKFGVKLLLITNGTVRNRELWERIVPQCAQIDVSMDSPLREDYEAIRAGGDYDLLLANLGRMVLLSSRMNPHSRPPLYLGMTLMKRNLSQVPLMVVLAGLIGFDGVRCSIMYPFTREMESEVVSTDSPGWRESAERGRTLAKALGLQLDMPGSGQDHGDPEALFDALRPEIATLRSSLEEAGVEVRDLRHYDPITSSDLPPTAVPRRETLFDPVARSKAGEALECPFLWQEVFVDAEGRIVSCCEPSHPIVGNLKKETLKEIWNGERMIRMRGNFNPRSPYFRRDPLCGPCAGEGFLRNNF